MSKKKTSTRINTKTKNPNVPIPSNSEYQYQVRHKGLKKRFPNGYSLKQIGVSSENDKKIKILKAIKGKTTDELIDDILTEYFKKADFKKMIGD